ncbi:hypothetical protein L1987_27434 [Smallanthus sonchifolius]|uniref:Uncharacterized protein n=1 Tax=Smallanthus sonchifolius TaxID=185202 RepID=A0ACB9IAY9_9ASTR|nr:hypothetical protein L1987_27434 [Smallanthus sonchifolius]
MATVFQTIDADVGTTTKPPKLQSAFEYRNWKQRMEKKFLVLDFKMWRSLKYVEVELENVDVVKQFMTFLPQKWLVYTIPIQRTENLNTFTLEEVYETLQNYEFESKGFVDTSASKPVGAALIALMVENTSLVCQAPAV